MTNQEKYKKLLVGKWANKHHCKLEVLDHIRECLEKDNHLKGGDVPKTDPLYDALDKELMDLKIVLDLYFEGSDWYGKRLDKFVEYLDQ